MSTKRWPSVPGVPPLGRKEGAKNHRFYLGTFNVRTLNKDEHIEEIEEDLQNIKWDIIGLAETRRNGRALILKSGNALYTSNGNQRGGSGTGFLINKSMVNRIVSFEAINDRISVLVMKINKLHSMTLVQVYMPTSDYDDDEVEEVYELIEQAMQRKTTYYNMVIGDFNAKIGVASEHAANFKGIGKWGTSGMNNRGLRLLEFADANILNITNTVFEKRRNRRWTGISPDKKTKNEIDFVFTNRPQIIKNFEVLNCLKMSDHRMVRVKIVLNEKLERLKLATKRTITISTEAINEKRDEFRIALRNKFSVLEVMNGEETDADKTGYNGFRDTVLETVKSMTQQKKGNKRNSKLSAKTKTLMEQRRNFKLNKLSTKNKVEYTELCKLVRREVRNDIRKYNTDLVRSYIEKNKGYRQARKAISVGRNVVTAVTDAKGNVVTEKNKILEECRTFYETLYRSQYHDTQYTTEEIEEDFPILESEIRFALNKMKHGKASGNDELVVDFLKAAEDEVVGRIAKVFTKILQSGEIPEDWKTEL